MAHHKGGLRAFAVALATLAAIAGATISFKIAQKTAILDAVHELRFRGQFTTHRLSPHEAQQVEASYKKAKEGLWIAQFVIMPLEVLLGAVAGFGFTLLVYLILERVVSWVACGFHDG